MDFTEHKTKFEQEAKRRNYSDRTIENYLSNLKRFFEWSTRDHPKNVNEDDLRKYLLLFKETNTQRSHHSAIKLFYNICLGQKDKFKYLPYAKKEKKLPIILSQEEVQQMFDSCENLKHRVILAVLYSTGMRVSELINLKWNHIDRSRKIINIIQGKGHKDRQCMLAPEIIPLLEAYWQKYRSKEYVLNGQFDLRYSASSIGQVIKQLAEKANINKRVYTHLMRHNCFSHMVENGVDINLIKILAGHKNVKTTMIYCSIADNVISKIKSPIGQINF